MASKKTLQNAPEEKDPESDSLMQAALIGSAFETVSRFGSAQKEHIFALTGNDYENNVRIKRGGLLDIAQSKVNKDYEKANLNQQAGYAAENKYVARENAKHIVNKDNVRVKHTDTGDSGKFDELHDHIITKDGKIIRTQQMKFVGKDAHQCLEKLTSKDYEKYIDNNTEITLPSDYFEPDANGSPKIINEIDTKIESLKKQIKSGKLDKEALAAKKHQLEKCKKLRKLVKNSKISKAEALEARTDPIWSTVKDMGKLAHQAGCEQAINGAVIGGSISLAMNALAVLRGDKDFKQGSVDFAKTTASSAAMGYATGAAGSLIKGCMQSSSSSFIRSASRTNLPAAIVSASIEIGRIMKMYLSQDITAGECSVKLGEAGVNMIGSAMFAVAGQTLIPVPIVGAMVGSMIGSVITAVSLDIIKISLNKAEQARNERIEIERQCQEHIRQLQEFNSNLNRYFEEYFTDMKASIIDALGQIRFSMENEDSDLFVGGCNKITQKLCGSTQFSDRRSFDTLVRSNEEMEF